jgi:hypothetical protein
MEAVGIVDPKRRVGEMLGLRLGDRRRDALGGEATPDRRQFLQDRTVAIALRGHAAGHAAEAVGSGEKAVQVVKAAVFGIDHHDGLDLLQSGGTLRPCFGGAGGRCATHACTTPRRPQER